MKLFVHVIFATVTILSALGFQEKKGLQVSVPPEGSQAPHLTAVPWSPRAVEGSQPMVGPLPSRAMEVLESGSNWEAQEGEPVARALQLQVLAGSKVIL